MKKEKDNNLLTPKLVASMQGEGLGLCVKDHVRLVSFQNEACIRTCGPQKDQVCDKGCMQSVYRSLGTYEIPTGLYYFSGTEVDGSVVDSVVIKDSQHLTTLFYPRKENVKQILEFLNTYNLSKREKEILTLVLQRASRKQISEQLCISLPTIKTHLNNIYKKLPKEWALKLKDRRVDSIL